MVQAGSGFLSQHSKELLFGLGASQRVVRLTVEWPSGPTQAFADLPLNQPSPDRGGRRASAGALPGARRRWPATSPRRRRRRRRRDLALRALPRSRLHAPRPARRGALALRPARAARGPPVLGDRGRRRRARRSSALAAGSDALAQAGIGALALAVDAPGGRREGPRRRRGRDDGARGRRQPRRSRSATPSSTATCS